MSRPRSEPRFKGMYLANESFSGAFADGRTFTVHQWQTRVVPEGDGLVLLERYPNYFEPIEAHYGVEAATSGPGEERA